MYSPQPIDSLALSNQFVLRQWIENIVDFELPIANECQLDQLTSAIAMLLPLRKLEPFPSALLSVLFAFLDTRIARHQTCMLERGAKVGIELEQRSRDAVSDRSCLARRTTASDIDDEVKLVRGFSQLQGLTNDHSQSLVGEVAVKRFMVDLNFARAGPQINSGCCRFAPPRSVILNFSHSNLSSYLPLSLS